MPVHDRYPDWQPDQRAFFDELVTEEWSSYLDAAAAAERELEVTRLVAMTRPRTILDVGCGAGFHDVALAERPGVARVVGIDVSEASIAAASRHNSHPRVVRRVADVHELEVDEPFDLVVSFQVIEHLEDPVGFLARNAALSTRHVAVFTPNRDRLANRARTVLGRGRKLEDPQHFAEYTVKDLTAMAGAAGLRLVGSFGYGFSVRLPGTSRPLLPPAATRRLGAALPSLGNRFGAVYALE